MASLGVRRHRVLITPRSTFNTAYGADPLALGFSAALRWHPLQRRGVSTSGADTKLPGQDRVVGDDKESRRPTITSLDGAEVRPPASEPLASSPLQAVKTQHARSVVPDSNSTTSPLLFPHTSPTRSSTRLQAYAPRLTALSRRTGVPFASLAGSFMVLHEITALVPLVMLFFVFQAAGAGAGIVAWLEDVRAEAAGSGTDAGTGADWEWRLAGMQTTDNASPPAAESGEKWKLWVRVWMDEAEEKIARVGKRYGILGYDKVNRDSNSAPASGSLSASSATENVANAIAAYVVVKVRDYTFTQVCLLGSTEPHRPYYPSGSVCPSRWPRLSPVSRCIPSGA